MEEAYLKELNDIKMVLKHYNGDEKLIDNFVKEIAIPGTLQEKIKQEQAKEEQKAVQKMSSEMTYEEKEEIKY